MSGKDPLYEMERQCVVAAGVETMPLPSRGRDAVVAASQSPEAWKKLALMSAKLFEATTTTTTFPLSQPTPSTTPLPVPSSSSPVTATSATMISSSSSTPLSTSSSPAPPTTTTTATASTENGSQVIVAATTTQQQSSSSMPSSSSQSASIFNEAAQFYQHQRHQYQTNDDYAAAMAYYRARILAADSTAKSYVDSLTKPSQCMPATTASSAAMTTTPFMPMIHSLETEAEDEAGVKPPYCEDLALDLAEYRWRISTRPHRLDLAKRRADQEALPFLERSALIRTSKDMGSYARLLAAARMEEKGTQIWTPPQGVDDDNDNCGTYNNIISNSNNNSETIENNAINDKKPDETVVEQGRGRRRKRRVSSNSNNSTDMGMVSQTLLVGSGNSDGEEDDDDDDYCCDDEGAERQLSEAEMMGGYDYAPYLRREDRDAMVSRIAFYPEITHQQAYVPDLPFPTTAAIAPMTKQSAEAGLCRAVGEILMENGFAEADERALAILTDMASELIAKLANNVRIAVDNNPKRFSNEFTLRKAWKSVCDTGIAPRKVIDEEAQRRQQKRSGNDEDNN